MKLDNVLRGNLRYTYRIYKYDYIYKVHAYNCHTRDSFYIIKWNDVEFASHVFIRRIEVLALM